LHLKSLHGISFSISSLPLLTFFNIHFSIVVLTLTIQFIKMKATMAVVLAVVVSAMAQIATVSEPALSEIHAAAATIKPQVTTSDVKGLVFDRFYQVWLENIVSNRNHSRIQKKARLTSS
jgi:hypothetical protein